MKWYSLLWVTGLLAFMEFPSWPLGLLLAAVALAWMTWPRWWPRA